MRRRSFLRLAGLTVGWPLIGLSWLSKRRAIAERVRLDFARGDVVQVDGWVLSRTEARWFRQGENRDERSAEPC